jgi:hypothetical protein
MYSDPLKVWKKIRWLEIYEETGPASVVNCPKIISQSTCLIYWILLNSTWGKMTLLPIFRIFSCPRMLTGDPSWIDYWCKESAKYGLQYRKMGTVPFFIMAWSSWSGHVMHIPQTSTGREARADFVLLRTSSRQRLAYPLSAPDRRIHGKSEMRPLRLQHSDCFARNDLRQLHVVSLSIIEYEAPMGIRKVR